MAPMSSTIASVSRNTCGRGTRRPSSARMPTAKAMSVAIGMPQPEPVSPPPATQVEQRRDDHAAERGERQGGARVAQLAVDQLA